MDDLPGNVHHAICGSFKETGIVCGNSENWKCYSVSINGSTATIANPNYPHYLGDIVGFNGAAIIFGGNDASSYFTERYNEASNTWEIVNSNNIWQDNYRDFSAVAAVDAVYSFGGAESFGSRVYRMDQDFNWEMLSQTLITARYGHLAMINCEFFEFETLFFLNDQYISEIKVTQFICLAALVIEKLRFSSYKTTQHLKYLNYHTHTAIPTILHWYSKLMKMNISVSSPTDKTLSLLMNY